MIYTTDLIQDLRFRQRCFTKIIVTLLLGLGVHFSPPAAAQMTTGTILGTVTDETGGVIPAAVVTARNIATNLERGTTSNEVGNYTLSNLPLGDYTLTAQAPSFQTFVREGLQLQVLQRMRIDIALQIGDVTERITVTEAAPLLNTDDAVFGDVIENKRVVELPLNGRNFNKLALLTPGINNGIPTGATLQNFLAGGIAVWAHGQRDTDNEWNLDGATMNIGFYNWNSFNPSVDAIQEFKIQTGNFSAEYGFQAGANINLVTKSGTNEFHGTVFNFLRNDALDARGFFPTSKPKLRQNQFGGTVGGPIIKNRTFFFANYEGLRVRQESFGRRIVPTAAQRTGDLSLKSDGTPFTGTLVDPSTGQPFANNTIPASRIAAQTQKIIPYYPDVNTPGTVFNFQILAPVTTDSDSQIHKVDHRIDDNNTIFGRFAYDDRNRPDPLIMATAINPEGFQRVTGLKATNGTITWTRIWSPTVLQDAKMAYNRSFIFQADPRELTEFNILNELGIPNIPASGQTNGFPSIRIDNFSTIGDRTNNPLIQPDEVFQYTYNLTVNRAKHNFKTGVDFRSVRSDRTQGITVRGRFNFRNNNPVGAGNGFADFLLGSPQSTQLGDRAWTIRMRQKRWGLYIQDDWHVLPTLTLNLGLRYEPSAPHYDQRGEVTNFDFAQGVPISMTAGQDFYPTDYNNFAPRFGFAWRPFSSEKTVVRGGYGIYYNATMNLALFRVGNNPPWTNSTTFFANPGAAALSFDEPFPTGAAGAVPPRNYGGLSSDFGVGYSQLRNFNIQQQITENDVIEIGYIGNFALGGDRVLNPNVAPLGPGAIQPRRRWPDIGGVVEVRSDAKAFYNAATIKYTRRFSKGLTILSSFTYSRSIDQSFSSVAGNPTGGAQSQNYNDLSQRGLSGSHRKHVYNTSFVWELPFGRGKRYLNQGGAAEWILGGWQVSGINTLESGGAFNVTVQGGGARLNQGGPGQRANRLRDGNLSGSERSVGRWFDTDAFVVPPLYTFGTEETRTLIMPGLFVFDFNVKKAFAITESIRLEFRAEFFNLTNNSNFRQPGNSLGSNTLGVISSAQPARISQMSLKVVF